MFAFEWESGVERVRSLLSLEYFDNDIRTGDTLKKEGKNPFTALRCGMPFPFCYVKPES